jgi:hypothetical protein
VSHGWKQAAFERRGHRGTRKNFVECLPKCCQFLAFLPYTPLVHTEFSLPPPHIAEDSHNPRQTL